MQYSGISSPVCSMVLWPSAIGPVSVSMMSAMRRARSLFVASLMTGHTALPVGVSACFPPFYPVHRDRHDARRRGQRSSGRQFGINDIPDAISQQIE
jgi:hypothetical protein